MRKRLQEFLFPAIVVSVALASFAIGRFSAPGEEKPGVTLYREETPPGLGAEGAGEGATPGSVVASKSGTKYHYPWCAGAQSIREENKIWFSTVAAAKAAGYEPAGNCKGLE